MASSFVDTVNKYKPLLKKCIPAGILRKSKKMMLDKISRQIAQTELEAYDPDRFEQGINLIGPIDSATGLGQSFRLVERVVRQTGESYLIYNYQQNTRNRIDISKYQDKLQSELHYGINLWHVNPSEFAEAYAVMGKEAFDHHYNIAFWLWELEDFPDEWVPYIRLLDEIWTPSEFISESIRKKTDKSVYTVPYYVTAETDTQKYDRAYFGLPDDKFLYLMMYDVQSITERKNPEGVIQAFQQAFQPDHGRAGLVIKLNSASDADIARIRADIGAYENVYLINRNMSKTEVNSLVADVDVFVSLHRAEGFGLVLAEAMLNHVPTIATNWSANTEFMNAECACMVDYKLITLEKEIPPYHKGCRWAEPDLQEAAEYMKRLEADPDYYRQISERAYAYLTEKLGIETIKELMMERIQNINHDRK